jgi:hypothetical protein
MFIIKENNIVFLVLCKMEGFYYIFYTLLELNEYERNLKD